jgi:membrane protein YdbS with pleckstrin-like domain
VYFRSYWADPLWRLLRIITFVTVALTLIILGVYLSGQTSWLDALAVAVIVNIVMNVALLIRTLIYRAQLHRRDDS